MQMQLVVPRERGQLPDLVAAIDAVLAREGVDQALVDDVQLITEEVVCNAMDYGYGPGQQHSISVDIGIADGLLTLEYKDDGAAYDPLSRPPPDLDADILDRPIGGLGVHLIRELSESASYTRTSTHNILRVVLRVATPGA